MKYNYQCDLLKNSSAAWLAGAGVRLTPGGWGGGSLIKLDLYFVQQIVHITLLREDDSLSESQENKVVIGGTEAEASAVSRCHGYLD